MRFSTTDGKVWDSIDMCPYCSLDTAGNHTGDCPNRNREFTPIKLNDHLVVIRKED